MSERRAWEVLDAERPVLTTLYGPQRARMLALGLGGGRLLVVSPGPMSDEARFAALEAHGRPAFLLAPNYFHNAGLATWKRRYPEARVVADPRAIPRLRRQVPGVEFEGLEPLVEALPTGVRLLSAPGARQGETGLSIALPGGVMWFVVDAIVNEKKLPGGLSGLVMRLIGFRTALMTNPAFKRLFLADKAGYKRWLLAELERDQPTWFVPAHGEPIRGAEVVARLREITASA